MARRRKCYSGIGGQAVTEGVMIRNHENYAVAIRKPDGEIEVEPENYQGILHGSKIKKLPFIRGIFKFLDSMILGTRCLSFSNTFYEEELDETKFDRLTNKVMRGRGEAVMTALVTLFSLVLAVGIFIVLPNYIASLFDGFIRNHSLMAIFEGALRILILIFYIWGISLIKDIRRLFGYHGAEHKCINCIEMGRPLTVRNVMRSSRIHKRCSTSFIFFVLFISIILFMFINLENPLYRAGIRILLMPVVAGISYEVLRLAGKSDNILLIILSLPGMVIQRMTTREPDREMIDVAIEAVEAVFDWKQYLKTTFGYEVDASWMDDEVKEEED